MQSYLLYAEDLDIFVGNAGVVDGMVSLADIPEEKLNDAFDEQFRRHRGVKMSSARQNVPFR